MLVLFPVATIQYLAFFFTGLFSVWAYYAEFDQVITGEGKVYPFSRLQTIEHFEGGVVIISHNREFANAVAQEKWIMEKYFT